jgi:hypothetical protein
MISCVSSTLGRTLNFIGVPMPGSSYTEYLESAWGESI